MIDLYGLAHSSDDTLFFAFWLGVGVAMLAVLMLVIVLVLRQIVLHRERVHASAVEFWQTILVATADPGHRKIPHLLRRDIGGFLQVWNEVHQGLRGGTTPYLARVAKEVGLEARLESQLRRGGFHTRLVAIIALGHVHNSVSYKRIEHFINHRNPTVSLCAARALMQIDPARAVSQFVPHIVKREDWAQGNIASILSEAPSEKVSRELSDATLQANVEIAPRLVRFLAGVSPDAAAPIIRKMLESSKDERLISTCLQVMTRSEDLDCVRPLLGHARWHVRMQAAVTLGRLGVAGDEQRLIVILTDSQWWVRYRAAQALSKMSLIGAEGLRRIQAAQTDKYARDIINHVLAEIDMGIVAGAAA